MELYLRNAWIRKHTTSPQEIANLLAVADRDIAQSQVPGLGPEWRFDIAYNAALQLAVAALAASGFRAERQNKHQRAFECLAFTVGLDRNDVDLLDRFRRKRHIAVYEQVGAVSDQEAAEMLSLSQRLRGIVAEWLGRVHPELA
ncbi:MAG: hypothetical protein HY721_02610 [Planctomycetes bacterium]|nr:hypothetical protein [Planctomycetota bacterium]